MSRAEGGCCRDLHCPPADIRSLGVGDRFAPHAQHLANAARGRANTWTRIWTHMAKRAAVTTTPMISLMRRKTCTTCIGVSCEVHPNTSVAALEYDALKLSTGFWEPGVLVDASFVVAAGLVLQAGCQQTDGVALLSTQQRRLRGHLEGAVGRGKPGRGGGGYAGQRDAVWRQPHTRADRASLSTKGECRH